MITLLFTYDIDFRYVTGYLLPYQKGFRVPYNVVLIDTPGFFGDSRGLEFDQQTVKSLQAFFNNKNGFRIEELSSLGLVIQASQSRLTAEQVNIKWNGEINPRPNSRIGEVWGEPSRVVLSL